jgi:hypothetical protein
MDSSCIQWNLVQETVLGDIELEWIAPVFNGYSPITAYKIERESPVGTGFSVLVANTGSLDTTYTDTTVSAPFDYNYRVRALNIFGESLPSNESINGVPFGGGSGDPDVTPDINCDHSPTIFELLVAAIGVHTVTLCWNGEILPQGNLTGFQINYTTPFGDPLTVVVNQTGNNDTTRLIQNLAGGTQYSFRVQGWQNGTANNMTGIANATTLPDSFDIGDINFDEAPNPFILDWIFARNNINSTSMDLLVNHPNSINATCTFDFKFARTNQTYSNLSTVPEGTDRQIANFTLHGVDNEIITLNCLDENSNSTGRYVVTQTDFPLKTQIKQWVCLVLLISSHLGLSYSQWLGLTGYIQE